MESFEQYLLRTAGPRVEVKTDGWLETPTGLVFDGDVKCPICWCYTGTGKRCSRCKNCIRRFDCEKCCMRVRVEKGMIDGIISCNWCQYCVGNCGQCYEKRPIILCEHCKGPFKRIDDHDYTTSFDYHNQWKLGGGWSQHQSNQVTCQLCKITTDSVYLCTNCIKVVKNETSDQLERCEWCTKWKTSIQKICRNCIKSCFVLCSGCSKWAENVSDQSDHPLCIDCIKVFDSTTITWKFIEIVESETDEI